MQRDTADSVADELVVTDHVLRGAALPDAIREDPHPRTPNLHAVILDVVVNNRDMVNAMMFRSDRSNGGCDASTMPHSPGLSFTLFWMIRMSWLAAVSSLTRMPSSFFVIVVPEMVEFQTPTKCNPPPQSPVSSVSNAGCPGQAPGSPVNAAVAFVLLTILLSRRDHVRSAHRKNAFPICILNGESGDIDMTEPRIVDSVDKDAVGEASRVDD